MHWLFYDYMPKYPRQRKVWLKIRFLHETDKAILAYCNGRKIWIAKSRIYKIRLREGVFEIFTKESSIDQLSIVSKKCC